MEGDLIGIIIQGGAVGIAVLLIIFAWKLTQQNAKQSENFTNALLNFNQSITRMEDNHTEIKTVIRENSEIIRKNSEVLDQVKTMIARHS